VFDTLFNQLTRLDRKDIAVSMLETLATVFRGRGKSTVGIINVHKMLFQCAAAKKAREIMYHVLGIFGMVGTLDLITLGAAQGQGDFARLNVWVESFREHCYLKFVMDCILEQLM
jgi:hypothetical protein